MHLSHRGSPSQVARAVSASPTVGPSLTWSGLRPVGGPKDDGNSSAPERRLIHHITPGLNNLFIWRVYGPQESIYTWREDGFGDGLIRIDKGLKRNLEDKNNILVENFKAQCFSCFSPLAT